MPQTISLVQRVEIASPCHASWVEMAGDDRVRFCSQCKLNVYNLSEMTEQEGERLIIEKEGKLCARIYRRADGTVITRDCPMGLAVIRRRFVGFAFRTAAMLVFLVSAIAQAIYARNHDPLARYPDFRPTVYGQTTATMKRWFATNAPPRIIPVSVQGQVYMGTPRFQPAIGATPPQSSTPKATSTWPGDVEPHGLIKGDSE